MQPHTVLHVLGTGSWEATGIARIVEQLVAGLDASRYRIAVCILGREGHVSRSLQELGVDVACARWDGKRSDIRGVTRFSHLLRRIRPSVVHLHTGGMISRMIIRTSTSSRLVVHYHSLFQEDLRERSSRTGKFADSIIANSHATAATVTGPRPLVVYPGVTTLPGVTRNNGNAHDAIVIGVASRLAPVKGIINLVRAADVLRNKGCRLKLRIAGDGPEHGALNEAVDRLNLASHVEFLGWIENTREFMQTLDIYVQPSLAEGFGIAALEAMAMGLPVVASKVGGLPELVRDGETGFLVRPEMISQLADRIETLASNPEQRLAMGNAARSRASHEFSAERSTRAVQGEYDRLLA